MTPQSDRLFLLFRLGREIKNLVPLFRYLVLQTETHAFCLALSAAALIGFFPSCMVMLSILNQVLGLHWQPEFITREGQRVLALESLPLAIQVVVQLYEGFFSSLGGFHSDRVFMNRQLASRFMEFESGGAVVSLLWVLLGAAAVFVPLEAGLNRLWRVHADRPYWKNQIVGFALTVLGTALALACLLAATALHWVVGFAPIRVLRDVLNFLVNHGTMACLFMIGVLVLYKFLPNRKISVVEVLPAAILAGGLMEIVRMLYFLFAPKLDRDQGPFAISVNFILLAYFETFIVLGCAFLASQSDRYPWISFAGPPPAPPPAPPGEPEQEEWAEP